MYISRTCPKKIAKETSKWTDAVARLENGYFANGAKKKSSSTTPPHAMVIIRISNGDSSVIEVCLSMERSGVQSMAKRPDRHVAYPFGVYCWSTVLIAACFWPSIHCIPAQKFVSVPAELNHNSSLCALDFNQGVCCHHYSTPARASKPPQECDAWSQLFAKWLEVLAIREWPDQRSSEVFGFGAEGQDFVVWLILSSRWLPECIT